MSYHHQDYSGTPIFEFKDKQGLTRFIPYALETIHELVKARQELKEAKDKPFCGAV